MRGATSFLRGIRDHPLFQPAPPMRGATRTHQLPLRQRQGFNPRPPCGERRLRTAARSSGRSFNPRPPCGERPLYIVVSERAQCCISHEWCKRRSETLDQRQKKDVIAVRTSPASHESLMFAPRELHAQRNVRCRRIKLTIPSHGVFTVTASALNPIFPLLYVVPSRRSHRSDPFGPIWFSRCEPLESSARTPRPQCNLMLSRSSTSRAEA